MTPAELPRQCQSRRRSRTPAGPASRSTVPVTPTARSRSRTPTAEVSHELPLPLARGRGTEPGWQPALTRSLRRPGPQAAGPRPAGGGSLSDLDSARATGRVTTNCSSWDARSPGLATRRMRRLG